MKAEGRRKKEARRLAGRQKATYIF